MSFARYEKFAKKQAETAKLMKEFKIQNEENRMGRQLQDSERARMFAPITKELGELKTGLTTEIADPSDPTKMIRVPKQQLLTGVSGVTPSGAPLAITDAGDVVIQEVGETGKISEVSLMNLFMANSGN